MKKSDLDKQLGSKIGGRLKSSAVPTRFGQRASDAADRREQRRRDAEAGLVAFACKLPMPLLERLRESSTGHPGGINGLVAELLEKGLR